MFRPISLIALLPIVEIVLLIGMGAMFGFWFTVAWIVATAMLGVWLLRSAGPRAMQKARSYTGPDQAPPVNEALGVFASWVGGILLILPGPLTDLVGLVLAVPLLRRLTFGLWLAKSLHAVVMKRKAAGQVYEGEVVPPRSGETIQKITIIRRDDKP